MATPIHSLNPSHLTKRSAPDDSDALRWFRVLCDQTPDAVVTMSLDGDVHYANEAATRWLGCRRSHEASLERLLEAIHPVDRPLAQRHFEAAAGTNYMSTPFPVRFRPPSAPAIYSELRILFSEHGGRKEMIVLGRDITREVTCDPLTGLVNRKRVEELLDRALNIDGKQSAVMIIGLDRFGDLIQRLGYAVGQQLIRTCADRIVRSVGARHLVARLEGVNFAVVVQSHKGLEELSDIAARVLSDIQRPTSLLGGEVRTTACIGIAQQAEKVSCADDALRAGHAALHAAQELGSGNAVAYEPGMLDAVEDRIALEGEIRRALDRDEFALHYQPVFELTTGKIVAYEALLRWFHATRGFVNPALVIDVACGAGLMVELGRWVLRTACKQAADWVATIPEAKDIVVNINLAAEQVTDSDLLADVLAILDETGAAPRNLNFEVTETSLIRDPEAAAATLNSIRELDIKLSLDDFGTGYSSLSYLQRFRFDTIKIDRSFIMEIGTETCSDTQLELVRTIVRLGAGLKLKVVAEGIETQDQLDFLANETCSHGQGYFFSRPLAPELAIDLL